MNLEEVRMRKFPSGLHLRLAEDSAFRERYRGHWHGRGSVRAGG